MTAVGAESKRIVVAGGGSAGWIAANLLSRLLRRPGSSPAITLVESARIGRIGVGEATIPTMRDTLRALGLPEAETLAACDATYKQGILFRDWAEKGANYFHPFSFRTLDEAARTEAQRDWLASDRSLPFIDMISEQPALALAGHAPKSTLDPDFQGPVSYAYHIDAERFADLLAARAVEEGIERIVDDITSVERTEGGDIAALSLASGRRIEGDFFIDCTGFARRLIGQEMGARFIDYGQWLMCDRAVAMRVPRAGGPIPPYTTSTALSAGWAWRIHLRGRMGAGYVYSSAHLDAEGAERELRATLGAASGIEARHIPFASGRLDRPWIGNCVAIGLAAGFLEPLESTGLFFVEEGTKMLAALFPEGRGSDRIATLYNARLAASYEECLDFINLHYRLTRRRDTAFWRDCASAARTTPALSEMLARWEQRAPTNYDFDGGRRLFGLVNWTAVLHGMGTVLNSGGPAPSQPPAIRAATRRLTLSLPRHEALAPPEPASAAE